MKEEKFRNPAYPEDDGLIKFIKAREMKKRNIVEKEKVDKLTKSEYMVEGYPHVFSYWSSQDFKSMGVKYTDLPVLEWNQMNKKRKQLIFDELFKLGWNELQRKVLEANYKFFRGE